MIFGLSQKQDRYIMHLDADAFFVSVEQALDPSLNGKCVAVGATSGRGVICSASYEARKYGLHAGLSSEKAKAMCPGLIIISPKFDVYKFYSNQIFDLLEQYSPLVERTSIDEGYIDLTGTELMWGMSPKDLALHILKLIQTKLKITVSGGLASNKLVAQVASKLHKPHKFIFVPHGHEKNFLWTLPLRAIPGVGKKTAESFAKKGFNEVGHFGSLQLEQVIKEFSLHGVHLWQKIHGLVKDEIQTDQDQPKSISNEITFQSNLTEISDVRHELLKLINKVSFRLRKHDMQASTISLKLRSENFHTFTFHRKLPYPSAFDGDMIDEGCYLLRENFHAHRPLRLIGFGVESLQSTYNLSIFQHDIDLKNKMLEHIDGLRRKHGLDIVNYGV